METVICKNCHLSVSVHKRAQEFSSWLAVDFQLHQLLMQNIANLKLGALVCLTHELSLHITGRPAAPVQPQSAPTTTQSNFQLRPRQRVPTASQPQAPGTPTVSAPRGRGVAARPLTPAGAQSSKPPMGIARPTVIQKPSPAPQGPRTPVGTRPLAVGRFAAAPAAVAAEVPVLPVSAQMPVPRRAMAPSRIAAILLRRQYSGDRVNLCRLCHYYLMPSVLFDAVGWAAVRA